MNKQHKELVESLKNPDAFVSTSHVALRWIEDHARPVFTVLALAAFLGVSYVSYTYWVSHVEGKAAEQLYKAETDLKKAEEKIREERAKKMQELTAAAGKSKVDTKPEQVRPVDYAKDYAAHVAKVREEIKNNAGTRPGVIAALGLSYFLIQQKQFPEALEVMKIPTLKPSANDLLGGFWRMHYGLVLLENNKSEEAMPLYSEILASEKLKPFHSEAMLKLGIAYELKGDSAKAKETYEKLGREFPNSEASNSAAQFLRLLELKSKQG